MNDANIQQVSECVASLVFRLVDGWEPTSPPLASPSRFVWGGQDMSGQARELAVRGDVLEVRAEGMVDHFDDHERRDSLRNQPFEGELEDGSIFAAESAFLDVDRASGRYWRVTHEARSPRLWVARLHGINSLRDAGNLSIRRYTTASDGSTSIQRSHGHHRFAGAYTYYLVNVSPLADEGTWFFVVDSGGAVPTRDLVYPDMLGLQFVLGRAFYFDVLYGLDDEQQVVALVGGRHGRDHGARGQIQTPVPVGFSVEHWPSVFFTAISETYRRRPELRLYIALSYYLDALVGFHVENKYLVLHVALEGLSYWLLGGDQGSEQPLVDKAKWRAWLQERKTEIMGLAVEGQGTALLNKITSVPKRRATSRVVQDAFAATGIGLTLTDEMADELDDEGRGLIVHAAVMFKESQVDVDAYLRRIATVRTMLVALVARSVRYGGAIVGWERERGRPYGEPDATWWPVDEGARRAARQRYVISSSATAPPTSRGGDAVLDTTNEERAVE